MLKNTAILHLTLPAFEGSLDELLLALKKEKIQITEISIVQILECYMSYLKTLKTYDMGFSSQVILVTSGLLYLKSKSLLPKHQKEASPEDIEEQQGELFSLHMEYPHFKNISSFLGTLETHHHHHFDYVPDSSVLEEKGTLECNLFDLVSAFSNILTHQNLSVSHIVPHEPIRLEDVIQRICKKLHNTPTIAFEELFKNDYTKRQLIVTFLAILELIRLGEIVFFQDHHFASFFISRTDTL